MDIIQTILSYVPHSAKSTSSGWTKFNSVCCHHRGHTRDTRQRSGVKTSLDTVSVHCFNCGFTASFKEGTTLSSKMKQWLQYAGADDTSINAIALQSIREKTSTTLSSVITAPPTFKETSLPEGAMLLTDAALEYEWAAKCLEYILNRGMYLDDCAWHWSPNMKNRVLIPFTMGGKIVGFSGRRIDDGTVKYYTESQPGYVYGLDLQKFESKCIIVCEGLLDAISVGGAAILGAEISPSQALLINRLNKDVIYVPDRDKTGKAAIPTAIAHGWSVSMPEWSPSIKDVNNACNVYGRLLTLRSIIDAAETSKLKIRLHEKMWYRNLG